MGVKLTDVFAGGMLSDVDAVIAGARYELWDYNGKMPNKVPAAHLSLLIEGETREQYYTIGDAKDWTIVDGGKRVDSKKRGFNKQSNWGQFLAALGEALTSGKQSTEWLSDDISCLVGLDGHWVQVTGAKIAQKDAEREKTVAVIDVVNALPGQKKAVAGVVTADDEAYALGVLGPIVEAAGPSGLARAMVAGKVFAAEKDPVKRNAVNKLAGNEAFLRANFDLVNGYLKLKS